MTGHKHIFVYRTTNVITGRYYIGVHHTDDLDDGYLGSGLILKRAIAKYGRDSMQRDVLKHHHTSQDAYAHERELVCNAVLADPLCYNLKEGGHGGWDYANKVLDTSGRRSSMTMGENNPMFGRSHTDTAKKQISEKKRGVPLGAQTQNHIEKKRISKCKVYLATDPMGHVHRIDDLPRFCEMHHLNYRTMKNLPINNRQPKSGACSGWRCKFAGD